jgi:hypothetical protein
MNGPVQGSRRLRIERLELDLRGIAPDTAEAAARVLGPALARELAALRGPVAGAERVDAGRMSSAAVPDPHDLAAGLARRIAGTIRGDVS